MMRLSVFLSVILMTLVSGACSSGPAKPAAAEKLRDRLEEDWKYWMSQYPELATSVGYPGQNARWTDYSPAAIDARASHLKESAQSLAAIGRAELSADEQVTYDLYKGLIDATIGGLAFHNDALPIRSVIPHNLSMPINQLEGIQQDIPRTFVLMPAATPDDYDNIISRLRSIPQLVDQTVALMEQGVAQRMTPPRVTLRDVPAQVEAQIVSDPLASPMLAAFRQWPASIAAADRDRLTTLAAAAYRESVAPAFRKLHTFLVSRYLPACRDAVGVNALSNGDALYAFNVRWHTTTAKSPREIHEIGLGEVKRIRAEMDRVIAGSGFTGGWDAFVTFLRQDPRFYFKDAASLLTAYRDVAKRADPQLAHLFGRLPQTPYGVQPVPDAIAPSQTTAYYDQGSFVAGRPANMFANTYKLDARPRWEMEALTLHEAVPGHHIQIALAQEREGLPAFRQHSSYTAFVEGWALYAESLGDEMGFYTDPYSRFGQLTYEMWRAIRLVVDTGLHSMGWTREQAIAFFKANAAKTEQDIIVEVDRYIVWPGQALGYKIGQLKIRELRNHAQSQLGPAFDIRAFHDTVLGQGAVPLDLLEQQVKGWIASKMPHH